MKRFMCVVLAVSIVLTMCFALSITTYAAITDNLVMWLTMDIDTSADNILFDAATESHSNAKLQNNPTTIADGAIGNAIHFDGGSSVTIPNKVQNSFTISFWVRTTETAPEDANWYKGRGLFDGEVGGVTDDMGISQNGDTVMYGVGNPDTNIKGTTAINDGQWHHIVCTRDQDSGEMKLYIDGKEEGSATHSNKAALNKPTDILIGGGHGYDSFVGDIDEVRIYDAVISNDDIQTLYKKEGGQDNPPMPVDDVKPFYKVAAFKKDTALFLKEGDLIKMKMAGEEVAPVEKDGVLFVPARFVAASFGEYASWDNSTRSVTLSAKGKSVTMKENSNEIIMQDGSKITASGAMYLTNDTIVWLPYGDVMAAFGQEVVTEGDIVMTTTAFAPIDDEVKSEVIEAFE